MLSRTRGRAGVVAVVLGLTNAAAANAQAAPSPVIDGCRASPVRLEVPSLHLTFEPYVANRGKLGCSDDSTGLIQSLSLGRFGDLSAITGRTFIDDAGTFNADAAIARAHLSLDGITIDTGVLEAKAHETCSGDGQTSGTVARLSVNGHALPLATLGQPLMLRVGGLATLYVNRVIKTSSDIVRRAVELDTAVGDVVVGEAIASNEDCR